MSASSEGLSSESGEVLGRRIDTGETIRAHWRQGRWSDMERLHSSPSDPVPWIAPTLIDPQVNGFAGVDFQQERVTVEEYEIAARGLLAHGCTRWFATFITDEWTSLLSKVQGLRIALRASTLLRSVIAGVHFEGPFLSNQPGFVGAHPALLTCDPTPQRLTALVEATQGLRCLMTLSPERPGSIAAIEHLTRAGWRISLGHTNASHQTLIEAVKAGASAVTHLGNGCPQELDRHDNIWWRLLDFPQLYVSVIPDTHHLPRLPFRALTRCIAEDRLLLTTDAASPAGAPPGRYYFGKLVLEVGSDRIVRQPGKTNFAGSALTPYEGVRNASTMLDQPWTALWSRITENHSKWLGLDHGLQIGAPASFCLMHPDSSKSMPLLSTTHYADLNSNLTS